MNRLIVRDSMEYDILRALALGHDYASIAMRVGRTESAVRGRVMRIRERNTLHTVAQLLYRFGREDERLGVEL